MTKNKSIDKILAVVFTMAMLSTFIFAYLVQAGFENDTEEIILYASDSSASFPSLTLDKTPITYGYHSSGYYQHIGATYFNYSKTPVYSGNDTWAMAINGSTLTTSQFGMYVFDIPNLEDWVITEITINQTKNQDTDLYEDWAFNFLAVDGVIGDDDVGQYVFINNGAGNTNTYANRTVLIPLSEALEIRENAGKHSQSVFSIIHKDKNSDGLSGWAWEMEIEIKGKKIATYDVSNYLMISVIAGNVIMFTVFVFMSDDIDIGGKRNDIPDKKRRK